MNHQSAIPEGRKKRRPTPSSVSSRKRVRPAHGTASLNQYHWASEDPQFRSLSHLEKLPTEILEVIFFHALTLSVDSGFLSLPRASPLLGNRLSSDYVRKAVFLRICSDQTPQIRHFSQTPVVRPDISTEQIKAQSWILRQPWLTHDFVKQCIPEYMVSILLHAMKGHHLPFLNQDTPPMMNAKLEPSIHKYLKTVDDTNPHKDFFEINYSSHEWVEKLPNSPEQHLALKLSPSEGAINLMVHPSQITSRISNHHWHTLSLHYDTQIPARLLHGPWTTPQVSLLRSLIIGGASVDWVHTTAGETAEQGIHDAIKEHNADAIRTLCTANGKYCKTRGVGVIPTQAHLLLAIDEGCHQDCVEVLLSAPKSECNLQDVQVVQRLHALRKDGMVERADWLSQRILDDSNARIRKARRGALVSNYGSGSR